MYSKEEIIAMQQTARKLKLKYPDEFLSMPPEDLQMLVNGYGPERWPESMRKILSWIFRKYPVPAAIHDLRYEFSDGSEVTRRAADTEFAANLKIVWLDCYRWSRWINPAAWYGALKLHSAITLTRKFGRWAWLESWRKKRSRGEENI